MKQSNEYAKWFEPHMFSDTPKTVFAALALSFALRLNEDDFERAMSEVISEWQVLNNSGIVPQPVPAYMSRSRSMKDEG